MEFLKKHYEKILLALVLLGLTVAVILLTIFIPGERKRLADYSSGLVNTKTLPPLPPPDTAPEEAALQRLQTAYTLDLTTKHRVFNPVLRTISSDGRLRKIVSPDQLGPRALKLVNVNPLYLTVSYVTNRANGYELRVRDESPFYPVERSVVIHPDSMTDPFILRRVAGPSDNPTALDLEFKGPSHETFTLKADPDEPFRKVAAYSADLRYPPEPNAQWNKVRPNLPGTRSVLHFEGADYKVIDVESNSVVVSEANNKRTTIPLTRPSE